MSQYQPDTTQHPEDEDRFSQEELTAADDPLRGALAKDLPPAVRQTLEGEEVDQEAFIVELTVCAAEVQEAVFALYGNADYRLDIWISMVKAYLILDSVPKVKDLIIGELVRGEDPFKLIDIKSGYSGDGYRALYDTLLHIVGRDDLEVQAKLLFMSKLQLFEDAALELLLEQGSYFRRTESGTSDTISEFLGRMVSGIPKDDSPTISDGRYVDRVMKGIRYEEVISGEITRSDAQALEHQQFLFRLLYRVQGQSKVSEAYWQRIEENPDFVETSYYIATKQERRVDADRFFCKLLRSICEESKSPADFEGRSIFLMLGHFERELAYRTFLDDPQNEYKLFRTGIRETGLKPPRDYMYLPQGRILILSAVEEDGDKTKLTYVNVTDKIERRAVSYSNLSSDLAELDAELARNLREMAKDVIRFKREYGEVLSRKKPSKSRSP